jgi:hypothetical protein
LKLLLAKIIEKCNKSWNVQHHKLPVVFCELSTKLCRTPPMNPRNFAVTFLQYGFPRRRNANGVKISKPMMRFPETFGEARKRFGLRFSLIAGIHNFELA